MHTLTIEQKFIKDSIFNDKRKSLQVYTLDAKAGSGKSFLCSTLILEWSKLSIRHRSIYVAPTNSAVQSFQNVLCERSKELNIPPYRSTIKTIYSLLQVDFSRKKDYKFYVSASRIFGGDEFETLFIIDEAGLINTRFTLRLIQFFNRASEYPARIVLVGDSTQLEPVGYVGKRPPLLGYYHLHLPPSHQFRLSINLRSSKENVQFKALLDYLYNEILQLIDMDGDDEYKQGSVEYNYVYMVEHLKECPNVHVLPKFIFSGEGGMVSHLKENPKFGFIGFLNSTVDQVMSLLAKDLDIPDTSGLYLSKDLGYKFTSGNTYSNKQFIDIKRNTYRWDIRQGRTVSDNYVEYKAVGMTFTGEEYCIDVRIPTSLETRKENLEIYRDLVRKVKQCDECKSLQKDCDQRWKRKYIYCDKHHNEIQKAVLNTGRDARFFTLYKAQGRSIDNVYIYGGEIKRIIGYYFREGLKEREEKKKMEAKKPKKKKRKIKEYRSFELKLKSDEKYNNYIIRPKLKQLKFFRVKEKKTDEKDDPFFNDIDETDIDTSKTTHLKLIPVDEKELKIEYDDTTREKEYFGVSPEPIEADSVANQYVTMDSWDKSLKQLYRTYKFNEFMTQNENEYYQLYALRMYRAFYVALSRSRKQVYFFTDPYFKILS